MAARKQLWHPDEVRAKIQASQLINRLHDHAFGVVELTPAQVRSIEVLLKKAVPDLSAVQISGENGGAIQVTWLKPD
jgi:hypothetical protein